MVPWSSPVSENDPKPSQQQQPVASAEVLAASATKHAAVTAAAMPTTAALPPVAGTAEPVHKDPAEATKKCNRWVESGLTKNPAIQFLLQNLVDSGCEPPDQFIRCEQCPNPAAGGFGMIQEERLGNKLNSPKSSLQQEQCQPNPELLQQQLQRQQAGNSKLTLKPEIYICQQYMDSEKHTHKTMVHELIHAVDLCRTKMDPLNNCVHMACTEIRAENLSGECSVLKEIPRMSRFAGHGAECVKRRAILSVRANPNCTDRASEYVEAAMFRCFQDTYPFEKHPNQL